MRLLRLNFLSGYVIGKDLRHDKENLILKPPIEKTLTHSIRRGNARLSGSSGCLVLKHAARIQAGQRHAYGGPTRAWRGNCGVFLTFSSILDYHSDSKSRMQVDIGSVHPPGQNLGVSYAIFRDLWVFGPDHFGLYSNSSMVSLLTCHRGVGMMSLTPPVFSKIDYHV